METKIYEALKTKFSNLGLGEKILKAHAEMLAGLEFVTDENLDTVIAGQEKSLKEFQSEADKSRTAQQKAEQELKDLKSKGGGGDGNPNPQPEKPLTEQRIAELMQAELAKFQKTQTETKEAEEAQQARAANILSKAKELQIPEWRINEGFNIKDDADDEAIKTYLTGVKKNITTAGLEEKEAFPLSTSKDFIDDEAKSFVAGLQKK